jgi:hypothetical protein
VKEPTIGVRPLNEPDHGVMLGDRLIAVCPDREKADLVVAGLRILQITSQPAEEVLRAPSERMNECSN